MDTRTLTGREAFDEYGRLAAAPRKDRQSHDEARLLSSAIGLLRVNPLADRVAVLVDNPDVDEEPWRLVVERDGDAL